MIDNKIHDYKHVNQPFPESKNTAHILKSKNSLCDKT